MMMMMREGGWAQGQRAEDPLSHPSCPHLAAVRPSSPPFASPHFGPVALHDTSVNK